MLTCDKCGAKGFITVEGDEFHCRLCGFVWYLEKEAGQTAEAGRRRRKRAVRQQAQGQRRGNMARSRIIKPEFWSDEKLAKLCLQARLLYIGLWNTSDDAGTTQGHPLWLKSQIFPYDQISTTQIRRWLQDLVNLGRILPYTVKGEQYYFIPGFLKHQKIQHPSPAKNPAPPRRFARNA